MAGGVPLVLKPDTSLDIDFQNPLFNDSEMFSYPVQIPLRLNRQFVRNVDDANSDMRPVSLEHTPVRIIADGMPFCAGTATMTPDEEVTDALSMNIDEGTQSFADLIADLTCRDIPIPAADRPHLLIGEKIGNLYVSVNYATNVKVVYEGKKGEKRWGTAGTSSLSDTFEPQALGFSYPGKCMVVNESSQEAVKKTTREYKDGNKVVVPRVEESYINVSTPYDDSYALGSGSRTAFYANARVCYKHYDVENGETSTNVVTDDPGNELENRGPYWVLDADRPQSGICFYVLYFLDCLFKYLDVDFDKSALMAIEDFRHLVFFTTHCRYDTELLHGSANAPFFHSTSQNGNNLDDLFADINLWLSSRGCGGKLSIQPIADKSVTDLVYTPCTLFGTPVGQPISVVAGQDGVQSITVTSTITSAEVSANIMAMYANSDNFPGATVSTVIKSLENAFGIKFHYDQEKRKVTAYLLRDVFRASRDAVSSAAVGSSANPRRLLSRELEMNKISEKITGVRMCYSAESDRREQQNNLRNGVRDYDTSYDYIEYPEDRTVTDKHYVDIYRSLSSGDMNVYIDRVTGNAYRVKIDGEATTAGEMHPVLFEVGQFKGVEYGVCSSENKDFVIEFINDFEPVPFSDVNYRRELAAAEEQFMGTDGTDYGLITGINAQASQCLLAAYMDEDMEHEFVEQKINNVLSSPIVDIYVQESLKLVESYDPTGTDDGNSPLQSYDWGLAIALMRGGGSDATIQSYDADYDGFGNSKWRTVAGLYALASDTMDQWGNDFDYNGVLDGIGAGERFSLKICAYKQPAWADGPICNSDEVDVGGNITRKVLSRGLFDTFMAEYAYFLLHRHKYKVRCVMEVAQIADIRNHWREWWLIGGKKCLINRVSASLSASKGLENVELEVYSL